MTEEARQAEPITDGYLATLREDIANQWGHTLCSTLRAAIGPVLARLAAVETENKYLQQELCRAQAVIEDFTMREFDD